MSERYFPPVTIIRKMKKKTIRTATAFAIVASLCGCGSTTIVGHRYPPVPVESVQLFYQEPKRPYEVIAFVGRLTGAEHISADIAGLRKEAAEVGADAVIVTSAKDMTMWEYAKANGKAIRWIKNAKRASSG